MITTYSNTSVFDLGMTEETDSGLISLLKRCTKAKFSNAEFY